MTGERSFPELLQQAQQMTSHTDSTGDDLPRVDRSLHQILHTASQVDQRSTATHNAQA